MTIPKTTYITSHVGPHPMHRDFVRALGFEIGRVDKWIRWLDRPRSRLGRYASWLTNGVALDVAKGTQIILTEGFQIPPPLHKALGRCERDQIVVCHHVGEAPYFLATRRYSWAVQQMMVKLMRTFDAHICVGREQERLVRQVLGPGDWNVHRAYVAHVADAKRPGLAACKPALDGRRVLFVGGIYSDWRTHYKGLDLLAGAFDKAGDRWSLTIVGVSKKSFAEFLPSYRHLTDRIEFVDFAGDLPALFARHDLMVLPARGDTFPTVVLEAMAAGLPVLVSNLTGNLEVVERAAPQLVVEAQVDAVLRGISDYLALPSAQRQEIATRSRKVAAEFTEAASVSAFERTLNAIYASLRPRR